MNAKSHHVVELKTEWKQNLNCMRVLRYSKRCARGVCYLQKNCSFGLKVWWMHTEAVANSCAWFDTIRCGQFGWLRNLNWILWLDLPRLVCKSRHFAIIHWNLMVHTNAKWLRFLGAVLTRAQYYYSADKGILPSLFVVKSRKLLRTRRPSAAQTSS